MWQRPAQFSWPPGLLGMPIQPFAFSIDADGTVFASNKTAWPGESARCAGLFRVSLATSAAFTATRTGMLRVKAADAQRGIGLH